MNNVFKFVIISIVFTIFVSSCKTDEGVLGSAPTPCEPYPECTKLPVMEDEMYSRTGEVLSETPDGNCTIVEEAISAENFDFLPNNFSDKYLGQIFRGTNSMDRAEWAPLLGGVRNSMYGTVVGPTVGEASFLLNPPALHTYNDAINEYKQQDVILDADAQMNYKVLEVNTKDKLKFDLKGRLKVGKWVDIEAGISNSDFEEKNIFVVEMIQEHAEALVSLPNDPKNLYNTWPNADQLGEWSPVMLTGISYGRAAYFIMKSSKGNSNSKKTLDAVFKAWGKVKLDIELTAEEENIINSMETQAIIYGGAQAPALGTIGGGVAGIIEYIRSGFLDRKAFGVPMSYKFKYIKDFSDAKLVSNLVYTYRDCEETTVNTEPDTKIEIVVKSAPFDNFDIQLVNGDNDYGGNGSPYVDGHADLEIINNKLYLNVNFVWEERKSDWTKGRAWKRFLVYTPEQDWNVKKVLSSNSFFMEYQEPSGDHNPEDFVYPNSMIRRIFMNCDTGGADLPGGEVGSDRTWLQLWLEDVELLLEKK